MLIQITNKCTMNCIHCLQDSLPEGEHMTSEVFHKSLELAARWQAQIINISGGEPTEHPQFYDMLKQADSFLDNRLHGNWLGIIESNGLFLSDNEKLDEVMNLLDTTNFKVLQITSVKGLYPAYDKVVYYFKKRLSRVKFKNWVGNQIMFVDHLQRIDDIGRAQRTEAHSMAAKYKWYPSCINGYLVGKQTPSIKELVNSLESRGVSCKPFIDYQGNIHLGESRFCQKIGDVDSSDEKLYGELIKQKPCCGCGITGERYKRVLEHPQTKEECLVKNIICGNTGKDV